jgi:EmrB/QacA subfamily drug resistance transporter
MENPTEKSGAATVFAVTLGTFMSSMDINVVNMALPILQSSFGVTISSIEWVAVAYLLALGATQLTFGRLSDLFGHKRLYVSGFLLFTLSSLACSFSRSLAILIGFRVLQAISAAMMQSSGVPLIVASVEPKNRGKSLGMVAVSVAVATCVGPALGGMLVSRFGWSSIFLINVPVGLAGTVLSAAVLQKDGQRQQNARFDAVGSILIAASLFFILLPLNLLSRSAIQTGPVLGALAAGIIFLAAFILVESKRRDPLLNLSLFRSRVFAGSNFAALFYYMAEFVMVFLSPYFFQKLYGFSAMNAGLMMLPMSVCMMIAAPLGGAISDRFDSRSVGSLGLLLMAVGIVSFAFYDSRTPVTVLAVGMALFGFGAGLFQTPNTSAVMGSVPASSRGIASSTLGTMRNTGMVIGEAMSAALIAFNMNLREPGLMAKGLSGDTLWKTAFLPAGHITCLAGAFCAVAALVLSLMRGSVQPAATQEEAA